MTDCPPAMRSSQEEDTCAAGHASLGSLFSLEFLISAFADKYWEWVTNESLDGPALSEDVNKLLLYCYIEKDYYDLIHINSFGSNSIFCGSALASVVHAGEHRPYNVLASYGAFVKPMPFTNELGIQMLIGVVMYVQNVSRHYNFVAHCCICGEMQVVKWNSLGHSTCSCSSFTQGPSTVTLSGCSTCQSHIASNAIKTSAPMCLRVEITWSLMQ
ncbi:unnamed protein product [Sphagnum troendelagicum]|uniref:Uncharacterized protein n=1 Tax=Sphagnum jensenii TaxID=128206 RepID=A0ABP0WG31_9BRYO